jgi:hypothetical protein
LIEDRITEDIEEKIYPKSCLSTWAAASEYSKNKGRQLLVTTGEQSHIFDRHVGIPRDITRINNITVNNAAEKNGITVIVTALF